MQAYIDIPSLLAFVACFLGAIIVFVGGGIAYHKIRDTETAEYVRDAALFLVGALVANLFWYGPLAVELFPN